MTEHTMTDEYPPVANGLPFPELAEDDSSDDEWPVRGPAKGIRLRLPVALLVTVVLVAAGFWGGAIAEKRHGGSSSSAASALAARFRGAGAAAGAAGGGFRGGGAAAGGTSAATGTLSVVDGNTLYVLTSAGALVKVTLGQSTAVTRNAKTPATGLRPGDAVVVQGSVGTNGDVTATSIAATAPGVGG